MKRLLGTGVVAATALLLLLPMSVAAAPKPHLPVDGQILYELNDPRLQDLVPYTINPDGTGSRQVYAQPMECPHWSPDGTQIASCGGPPGADTTILTVDSGATRFLPSVSADLISPCYVWSNDGTHLACEAFNDDDPSHNGIFTVRVRDWGGARRVTTNAGGSDVPGDYSPNSRQLVFSRSSGEDGSTGLYLVNVNGTGLTRLTRPDLQVGSTGSWSPRGNQILFSARPDADHRQVLWLIHRDGTGLRRLTVDGVPCGGAFDDPGSVGCANPDWSPSGRQLVFRVNTSTESSLWRADADGSHPSLVTDLGFDPGEDIGWGTHPLAVSG